MSSLFSRNQISLRKVSRTGISFVLNELSTTILSVECLFNDKGSFRSQNWEKEN